MAHHSSHLARARRAPASGRGRPRVAHAAAIGTVGVASLAAAACGGGPAAPGPADRPTAPAAEAPALPFPDSVTAGRGLPPRATDSTTRALGGDTLVVSHVMVLPAYSLRPGQVAPGHPASGPMRINVRLFARDTSVSVLRDRPLALSACPITLRLYRAPDRSGPPAWRSDAATGASACPTATQFRLGDYTFEWLAPAIVGDSLPAGRYFLAHAVRLADGRSLEYALGSAYLTADSTPPTRDRSALRVTAHSEVVGQAPRALRATVVVANTGARPVRFEHGACTPNLRLYQGSATAGAPVWRSELRRPAGVPPEHGGYACPAILLGKVLAPGDSALFPTTVPLAEVLADSLRADRYAVVAELELLNDDLPVDRWRATYRVDAGVVDLSRAPDPLPASRLLDGIAYVATTRLIRGTAPGTDTVRTLVLVRNDRPTPAEVEVARDCPVIAYGYRSAALRDSFPLQAPAWQGSRPCTLHPHRFALAAGASWVFAHDVPAAEIVARAGPGRYWFTAWVAGRPDVKLAAGDVDVRP